MPPVAAAASDVLVSRSTQFANRNLAQVLTARPHVAFFRVLSRIAARTPSFLLYLAYLSGLADVLVL